MNQNTILVVEDNSIVGKDIQKRLTDMGYSVPSVVASGERAIQCADELRPDLILMDIMLKGDMDGMDAARQIIARHNIPVVYLTAYSDDSTLQKAKATGAFGYLLKPFNEAELRTTIEVTLSKHRLEREVRESKQWLETTLDNITDFVITTDTRGTVISVNAVATRMLGGTAGEYVGKHIHDCVRLVDARTSQPVTFPEAALPESTFPSRSALLLLRDGREIPVEDRSQLLHDDAGKTLGTIIVLQDVTERRNAGEEIGRLNKELQMRVNELTALNRELTAFNYSVSHDLRTPLIAIEGFARILREESATSLDGEARTHVAIIQKNAQSLLHTIDNLMLFARLSRSQIEKDHIDMAVEGKRVFQELSISAPKGRAELKVGNLPAAFGDPAMIRQVLVSLFSNGMKFTREDESAVIEFAGEIDGRECVYHVRDNGIGFDTTGVHQMFDLFQRLHNATGYEGSGIGLAIAHRIIERHGGKVWAEGQPNRGATFHFTLPRPRV